MDIHSWTKGILQWFPPYTRFYATCIQRFPETLLMFLFHLVEVWQLRFPVRVCRSSTLDTQRPSVPRAKCSVHYHFNSRAMTMTLKMANSIVIHNFAYSTPSSYNWAKAHSCVFPKIFSLRIHIKKCSRYNKLNIFCRLFTISTGHNNVFYWKHFASLLLRTLILPFQILNNSL